MHDHKTLVEVKIRTSRRTRSYLKLAAIILLVLSPIALIGVLQLVLCRSEHPGRAVGECLRR